MGNQQIRNGGPQFCSPSLRYGGPKFCSPSSNPLPKKVRVEKSFRVDYNSVKNQNTEPTKRVVHQQRMPEAGKQQQMQEEPKEMLVEVAGMLKKPKIDVQIQVEPNVLERVDAKEINKTSVFEGIYGNISLTSNGFVQYKDMAGTEFFDKYESDKIQKTFPTGISFGGLTKSLWFKNGVERDECFDVMVGNPSHFSISVMANPENYNVPSCPIPREEKKNSSNMKVFEGIHGKKVVICQGNSVQYTDLDGVKHSDVYNMHTIRKCYPHGICFGDLDRTVWLTDERERDLCFIFMQASNGFEEEKNQEMTFPGLYGSVVVREDKINFTSLIGNRITGACYNPRAIHRIFPMGIGGGGLPHSIWFKEFDDMENCFNAMEQKCH